MFFQPNETISKNAEEKTQIVKTVRLHNFSKRVEIVQSSELCYFDRISQNAISNFAVERVLRKFVAAGNVFIKLYLKVKFWKWRRSIDQKIVFKYSSYRSHYPHKLEINVSDIWPFRKGLQIIVGYIWEIYKNKTLRALRIWKQYCRDILLTLLRYFNKWNIKAARLKLNRLNAQRFCILTKTFAKKVLKARKSFYWQQFKNATERVLVRRYVRLLFRCWRTVVKAMHKGRLRVKHWAIEGLIEHTIEEQNSQYQIHQKWITIQQKCVKRYAMLAWYRLYRSKMLIRKVLYSYCRDQLRKCWNTWLTFITIITMSDFNDNNENNISLNSSKHSRSSPRPSRSPRGSVSSPKPALFVTLSGSHRDFQNNNNLKRRHRSPVVRKPGVPSHIVRTAKAAVKLPAEELIQIRIQRLLAADRLYEQQRCSTAPS